jgi:tagaturonate reductase
VIAFFNEVWKGDNMDQVANAVLANAKFWGEDITKIEGLSKSVAQSLNEVELSF